MIDIILKKIDPKSRDEIICDKSITIQKLNSILWWLHGVQILHHP